MSEKKQEFHGSDLEKVEAYYGIKIEDIIPFAGNVYPLGISPLLMNSMASLIELILWGGGGGLRGGGRAANILTVIIKSFVPPLHFTAMSQWNISLLEMVQLR